MTHKKPVGVRLLSLPNNQKRISSLLLGRIDIHIEVPRVDYEKLNNRRVGESSDDIHASVQAVHTTQNKHFSKTANRPCSSNLSIFDAPQSKRITSIFNHLKRTLSKIHVWCGCGIAYCRYISIMKIITYRCILLTSNDYAESQVRSEDAV